jgi:glutamate formiminotransferase
MFADFKAGDFDRSNLCTNQFEHLRVQRFHHPAHLPVTALRDRNLEKRVSRGITNALHSRRARRTIGEFDAAAQAVQLLLRKQNRRLHEIRLGHLRLWTHDVVPEIGVVGHDKQPGGVLIQTAHGKNPFAGAGQQIVHRLPAFGILISGQVTLRFVEQQIAFFRRRECTTVQCDAVASHIDPKIGRLNYFPVDRDAAGSNPAPRVGPRADSGLRQDSIQRLRVVLRSTHFLSSYSVIECVPNFSEGRDDGVVRSIVESIGSAEGVLVLGWEMDRDHNRSVVTFAGPPDAVIEGAIRGVGRAAELIDIRQHEGVHPRVGAADVIPFVPLDGGTLEQCVAAAHLAGLEIWNRLRVPVYFYESAAEVSGRERLERVRRPGFDGLPPDVGDVAAHPTVGAAVVGARGFLIAFNINLATRDVEIAQAIAKKIRESSGGFPFVKAIGLTIASRDCAQVSMNFVNFAETPFDEVWGEVVREAARLGTSVESAQLIGFVPRRAFEQAPDFFERAENFDESRVLETRIAQLLK